MSAISRGLSFVGIAFAVGCGGQIAAPISDVGDIREDDEVATGDIVNPPPPYRDENANRDGDKPPITIPPAQAHALLRANECASIVHTGGADHVGRIDLASGTITTGPKLVLAGSAIFTETTAIGVKGADLWFCTGMSGGKVARAPLATGIAQQFDVPCRLVTADDSGIYVMNDRSHTVYRYADEAAMKSKTPTDSKAGYETGALGMSADGVIAQGYPDSGVRMVSGDVLSLSGQNGSIWGLSAASGNRFIVGNGVGLLQAFDASTGASLGDITQYVHAGTVSSGFRGLACNRSQ